MSLCCELTSAEVLFICSESSCTADGPSGLRAPGATWKHPCGLRLAWWDSRNWGNRVLQGHLLLLTDIDDSALGEAEVSAEVVDALHSSFAGII